MRTFLVILVALPICGLLFDYNLDYWFGADIPYYADCVAGLIWVAVNVPVAVLALVLQYCDIVSPFLT